MEPDTKIDFHNLVVNNYYVGKLATIDRMVDADTLMCSIDVGYSIEYRPKKGIRLLGIDGPEIHSKNLKEKKAAEICRQEVQDTLTYYKKVGQIWVISKKWDMYGRVLADLYFKDPNNIDITSINKILLDKGVVKEYDGQGKRVPWTDQELDIVIDKYKLNQFII